MDALFTALAPALTSSLASGASGALAGPAAAEDHQVKNDLIRAQTAWQLAHAQNYGHLQRAASDAMTALQAGLKSDPNFLHTDYGRFLSNRAGHFDLLKNNAAVSANDALAASRGQHGDLWESQTQTENALRDPRTYAQNMEGDRRWAESQQIQGLTPEKIAEMRSRTDLNKARGLSEASLQAMRGWQAQLAQQRAEHEKARAAATKSGTSHALNLYSYADLLNNRINDALDAGETPDPNLLAAYDDVRTKMRGPEYGALPLGSPGVYNRNTSEIPQPAVPEKKGFLGWGGAPATPATPPAMKPLDLTPRPRPLTAAPRAALPGAPETDQNLLKAQKLIKERGIKFADTQLRTNKALTPTEKLALQQAIEKAMTASSTHE